MDANKYFEEIATYCYYAKKEVGQNFLINQSVAKRIIDFLEVKEGDNVLEIGSGAGSLTYFLKDANGEKTAIDIDPGLVVKLQNDFRSDDIKIIQENALKINMDNFDLIVGNLPYYITSSIIERIALETPRLRRAVLMVQKEAAARILSGPKSKDYGALNVILSLRFRSKRLLNVDRQQFIPVPNVESTVLEMDANDIDTKKLKDVYLIAKQLFLHRRKNILSNLTTIIKSRDTASGILSKANIALNARPEEIEAEKFLELTNLIAREIEPSKMA